jgi:hypothetical protein
MACMWVMGQSWTNERIPGCWRRREFRRVKGREEGHILRVVKIVLPGLEPSERFLE